MTPCSDGQDDLENMGLAGWRDFRYLKQAVRLTTVLSRRMNNLDTFKSDDVVSYYAESPSKLQAPEAAILERVQPILEHKAMLDLGVGGGRTTVYFSKLAGTYVGLDYSAPMVDVCKKRFAGSGMTFVTGDVRDLSAFESASFDFVLFSFNGLDYLNHNDRLLALREMHRVTRPGGAVCFSSHNLRAFRSVHSRLKVLPNRCLSGWMKRAAKVTYSRLLNPSPRKLADRPFAVLNDGVFDFRLQTYYVAPGEQLSQLGALGLTDVELYGQDGRTISDSAADSTTDLWIYYLGFVG